MSNVWHDRLQKLHTLPPHPIVVDLMKKLDSATERSTALEVEILNAFFPHSRGPYTIHNDHPHMVNVPVNVEDEDDWNDYIRDDLCFFPFPEFMLRLDTANWFFNTVLPLHGFALHSRPPSCNVKFKSDDLNCFGYNLPTALMNGAMRMVYKITFEEKRRHG